MDTLATDVPAAHVELDRLGRTLATGAVDVIAYFGRPHTAHGATEAINREVVSRSRQRSFGDC